ncbi:MAG TPA: hypothetical protein VIK00_05505, partial [Candidatus Limnocylindrales bacterium]
MPARNTVISKHLAWRAVGDSIATPPDRWVNVMAGLVGYRGVGQVRLNNRRRLLAGGITLTAAL